MKYQKSIEPIEKFIEEWKDLTFKYFESKYQERLDLLNWLSDTHFENQMERINKHREVFSKFRANMSKHDYALITDYPLSSIKQIIEEDGEQRKIEFIKRIEKITGIIQEAYLYIGTDLSINGTAHGLKGSARVYSIIAGGYNIQKAHYRVLIKEIKNGKK